MGTLFGLNIKSVTANYTTTNQDSVIIANTTSGQIIITLASAAISAGQFLLIKRVGVSRVTIQTTGSDKIDDANSVLLSTNFAQKMLVSDGVSIWLKLA